MFGTRDGRPVVVKVARGVGDEWRSGEITAVFGGRGVVQVHDHVDGAALLERLVPGTPLVSLVLEGRDDESTEVLAALLRRMSPGDPPVACATVEAWGLGFERYLATNDTQFRASSSSTRSACSRSSRRHSASLRYCTATCSITTCCVTSGAAGSRSTRKG